MFAVQCSFCQHENVPGARFCAECGSPLHLKVCPNPECGKVSDVNATRCENCGTSFPRIELAPTDTTSNASASSQDAAPKGKPATAAWPLIIVAIVAGGLPLLWANRSLLPEPKTWKPSREAAKPADPPAPATARPTTAAAVIDPPPLPDPAPPKEAPVPAVVQTVVDRPAAVTRTQPPSRGKARINGRPAAERAASKPVATAEPRTPLRPCTEAVAALGLCDPSQARQ